MKQITTLTLVTIALVCPLAAADYPAPVMVLPGEEVLSQSFDTDAALDEAILSFRKEAHHMIKDGSLEVIPPAVAYEGQNKATKWSSSSIARAGLNNLPQELLCQVRWQYLKPENSDELKRISTYLDLGHRWIRVTFTDEGTTLLLENHLVGKDSETTSIVLQESPGLELTPGKWYDITIEIKGDEVVFQIDGTTLYGQHELISRERPASFNIDSSGIGYRVDEIKVFAAGDTQPNWEATKQEFIK